MQKGHNLTVSDRELYRLLAFPESLTLHPTTQDTAKG